LPPREEAVRRGRARFLQRAAELRELKSQSRRHTLSAFQRFAVALTLSAILLASGTGLVRASSSALPGEELYPVKRSWEGLRLFLAFDDDRRENLEFEFENERLEEVSELLAEGRRQTIRFVGLFQAVNGETFVSGVRILVSEETRLPQQVIGNGAAVLVTGHTDAEGFVQAESIELLPADTRVPPGVPLEAEREPEGKSEDSSGSGSGSGSESQDESSGSEKENSEDRDEIEKDESNPEGGSKSGSGGGDDENDGSGSGGGDDDSGSGGGGGDDDDD
jgi:hypothetical protein